MPKQFVAVKFRPEDTRQYTYAWDGEPLHDGDVVRVQDRSGEGWKKVFVVSTTDEAPPFDCKPILGRHVEEPDAATDPASVLRASTDALDTPLTF